MSSDNPAITTLMEKPKRIKGTVELDCFLYERPVKLDGVFSPHIELVFVYVLKDDLFLVDGVEFRNPSPVLQKAGRDAYIAPAEKGKDAYVQMHLQGRPFFYEKDKDSRSFAAPGMFSGPLKVQGYKKTSLGKASVDWHRWMPPGLPEDSNLLRLKLRGTMATVTAE